MLYERIKIIFFSVAGTEANQEPTFTITDTKHYVLFLTLPTQDNVKLQETKSKYLDFLAESSFQSVNRLSYFVI